MSPASCATFPDKDVAILLSTYNGESFLPAQLNSFLAQTHEHWVLHWRDDGSTDSTVEIMRAFARQAGAERCVESPSSGPHLGVTASFLTLLRENIGAMAVAFSDQDDVWLPEKLRCALERLSMAGDSPALYCARQYLVDQNLHAARLSAPHAGTEGFPACLTQNIANGNTLVMNNAAAALVAASREPAGTVHDWWSYIIVSACGGKILFDDRPQVLYRLHKTNLIGRYQPFHGRALAALRRGSAVYMTMMRRHAMALLAQSSRLTPEARQDLELVRDGLTGGIASRITALRCPRFRRRTYLENLLFRYWFLTNRQFFAAKPRGVATRKQPHPTAHYQKTKG
ncbi:glycosyltransferase [Acidocella sp.]|uniref:glycosyltransferase n=1 Tax=Acidocella sp. TaxID=50710 RepID=UPI003D0213B3